MDKEIGINWQSKFSDKNKEYIEEEIHNHVADSLENGYHKGQLSGEQPDYSGYWEVKIEKDDNDEELRNEEVARLIRDGFTSGHYPTFIFKANVWKKYAHGGTTPVGPIAQGTILYGITGVPVKVLQYDDRFGGRVLVERADGVIIPVPKPIWRPLKKFTIEPKYAHGGTIASAWQKIINWFNSPI